MIFSTPSHKLLTCISIFAKTRYKEKQIRQKGPLEDNLDEIAQYKLMISTFFLPVIWGFWVLMTFPIAMVSGPGIVVLMWLTIRWLEDLIHNAKSMLSLLRLLFMTQDTMYSLRDTRQELAGRVHEFAVKQLGLPDDPEELVKENKTRKADVGLLGKLSGSYFSMKRRRRKVRILRSPAAGCTLKAGFLTQLSWPLFFLIGLE